MSRPTVDFKNPDYVSIYQWREKKLKQLRANPFLLSGLRDYYKDNPIDFMEDWGMTFDPRNVGTHLPAAMPFILFPRQREWLEEVLAAWKKPEPLLTEKSRDVGISWLATGLGASICLFNRDVTIGYGSRKEEYVDDLGDPKALFFKARQFISMLPKEFRGGWEQRKHAPFMRISFPNTNSVMTGEAGDNIGRGGRTSLFFVDESAHLQRPHLVDAALSANTNCRIDMSSVNGMANSFAERRHSGNVKVFTFHWRDDPRKDDAWYAKKSKELDAITVAQEIDLNYNASTESLIPALWVNAALDAHLKLGIKPTGERRGALDIADEGKDLNAFAGGHGIVIDHIESWSGKGSDIYGSVEKAFDICDIYHYSGGFHFDSDGLGSGARGDARKINEARKAKKQKEITVQSWRGSASPAFPEKSMVEGRTNEDFFANAKAQGWWNLRILFQNTYRAVIEGLPFDQDELISISSAAPEYRRLITELSQITYTKNSAGKIVIDKAPDGTKSPNHADAVMILRAPKDKKARGFFDMD